MLRTLHMGVGSLKRVRCCLKCDFGTLSDIGEIVLRDFCRTLQFLWKMKDYKEALDPIPANVAALPGRWKSGVNSLH